MKKYFCKLSLLALLISLAGISAGTVWAQSTPEPVSVNNENTMNELNRFQSLECFEKPFVEIVGALKEQTGLQIRIHESAIDNNLEDDTPITFHLESTRMATILDLLVDPWQCTYIIQDGIVIIASEDYAIENPMREVLDCTELLQTIKPMTVKRPVRSGAFGGGGGGGGGGVFQVAEGDGTSPQQTASGGGSATDNPAPARRTSVEQYETILVTPADQLIELIIDTVDPDSWEVNGGTARMRELNGKLIVVQTVSNIRDIKELLESLR